MSFFDAPGFYWNPVQYVSKYIDEWSAKGCSSEKDCEDSLYLFLHDRLPKLQIVKQYGRGRSHVDLLIQDKVMVELKYDLTSTGEYQRLIGQLAEESGQAWHVA